MRLILATLLTCLSFASAQAHHLVEVKSNADVATTMDRLEAAVTDAGATVFARVDHAEGAASVDMTLPAMQVLIFGNPKVGTLAMKANPLSGLHLPMKVLVYDADGQTMLVYEDPKKMLTNLDLMGDTGFLDKMSGALKKLTAATAE